MSDKKYRRQLKSYVKRFRALKRYDSFVETVSALLASPQSIVEQLQTLLTLDDEKSVKIAVSVIGWLRISKFTPQLIALYEKAQDNLLLWTTMTTLGLVEDKEAYQFLLTTLQDTHNTQSRIQAACGLQNGKHPDAVAPLLTIAQNTAEDPTLRGMAIEALSYQVDKTFLPFLLPFLQDAKAVVRWDALYAVGKLGDVTLKAHVEPLLDDTSPIEFQSSSSIARDAREILDTWAEKST